MSLFWSLVVASVLTFLGSSQAAPSCDISAIMPCLTPIMIYGQSQEARQIAALQRTGKEMDITENQLMTICRAVQGFTSCFAEYTQRCVDRNIKDAHDFVQGSVQLLEVCDKPNIYAKFKVLASCNKALNASDSTYQGCINKGQNSIRSLQGESQFRDPNSALQLMRTGTVLRDVCCGMKEMNTCLSPKYQTCSVEAADLNTQVFDAVFSAYGCQQKVANGCPVHA